MAGAPMADPHALNGKLPRPDRTVEVLVIGAGPAGIAAAIEAAKRGAQVLLVDENPVSASLMGLDTPLYFGGRMTPAVQRQARMIEQLLAASPDLEIAMELGVEVALGTYAWGAFVNGPGLGTLPEPVVGLADEDRAWMVGFGKLILATGARDIALSFAGWDLPGVMGANGLASLLDRYDAFSGSRIVVLGSGDLGLETARRALDRGLEVAAIIEVRDAVQGNPAAAADLRARGVEILTGQVIHRAHGGLDGVGRVDVGPVAGPVRSIECDTVCLAVGLVPAIELLNVLGGALSLDSGRGGHAPVTHDGVTTSLPDIYVAGDCSGLAGSGPEGAARATAQGVAAARTALGQATMPLAAAPASDSLGYQLDWMRALIAVSSDTVIVCQCEEVSRGDLLGVQPPRYLDRPARMAARDIHSLNADGPVNQDQIKRLTRACMGACQARRCREQVALILALATQSPVDAIPLAGFRAPVRPLPLKVLADWNEAAAMGEGWDVWFGIPSQWVPYQDIGSDREAMHIAVLGGDMHL
ncbi:NAD(P)/FAD-dependent oxidoreductase [Phenylobacterium sp.]|uniref:FAD/NAD(P)-dependent oxidoreductase n=1 Tax=Phenylobacterium sp. TaxID=1871053 RepID=UPI00286A69AD|nr:NAD(P)/FAD-dependent oxidoreductase [Phenylobacterium sp.]